MAPGSRVSEEMNLESPMFVERGGLLTLSVVLAVVVLLTACDSCTGTDPATEGGDGAAVTSGPIDRHWPCRDIGSCEPICQRCEPGNCATSDGWGCQALGKLRLQGEGFDLDKAAEAFRRGCDGANPLSCVSLGLQVQDGRGAEPSADKAMALYLKACDAGVGVGCFNAALMNEFGAGVPVDTSKANELFARAHERYQTQCQAGDADWCMNLGVLYEGGHGVSANDATARSWYKKGCDLGFAESCVNDLLTGLRTGAVKGPDAIVKLEQQCNATPSDALSCSVLGQIKMKGEFGLDKDPAAAVTLLDKACIGGNRQACLSAAAMQGLGADGIEKNPEKEQKYVARGCLLGSGASCAVAGQLAAQRKDQAASADWFERGCNIGHGESCGFAALIWEGGFGGKPADPAKALRLYGEGCKAANPASCIALINKDQPLPLPPERATRILNGACQRGVQKACARLKGPVR